MEPLRIFVGWDSREDIAFQVSKASLERHASVPLQVVPLVQAELRAAGLYHRPEDPLATTEFTYTRFLVPHLAGHAGWALFCDCDFLWTDDVARLFRLADDRYALMCVQHDYRPPEAVKMDGRAQTQYPRKNWSSLMLINCGHPANSVLTPDVANREGGAFLHRFQWLDDAVIDALPLTWNWLEGWSEPPEGAPPAAIHFTRGGPWFEAWQTVDYAALWCAERDNLPPDARGVVSAASD